MNLYIAVMQWSESFDPLPTEAHVAEGAALLPSP